MFGPKTGSVIAAQYTAATEQYIASVRGLAADAADRASVVRERVAELESELSLLRGVQEDIAENLGG